MNSIIEQMLLLIPSVINNIVIPFTLFLVLLMLVWVLSNSIANRIISAIWKVFKIDETLEKFKLKDALLGIDIKSVFSTLLFVYLLLIGMILAMDLSIKRVAGALEMQQVLRSILTYMSSLFQGVIILVLFLIIADLISDRIREKDHLVMKDYLAMITQVFIAILGFVIAMPAIFPSSNMQLLGQIVLVMFAGIALAFALAFGLAFGLGGQDVVAKRLEKFVKENIDK